MRVKGKEEPVAIYDPLGLAKDLSAATFDELKLWQHALHLYRAREWDQAELQIYNLRQRAPACRLYAIYAEHIMALRADPSDAWWNGVTTYQTK